MRINKLTQAGRWLVLSLVLGAVFGLAACNEANGTERVPGTYPPESEIDRSRHQVDTGDGDSGDGDGDGDSGDGDGDSGDAGAGDSGAGDGDDEDAGM